MIVLARCGMRILPWGLAIGMGFLPVQALAQQCYPPAGTITTQGHGEVKVRPDSLSVNVTVETKADTLAGARAETNQKMQAVITALKGLHIAGMKLETQGVNVYPIQGYTAKNKLPKVIGYQANNGLNVSVVGASVDTLGDDGSRIVDTALNAGATNVGGLNFFVNDMAMARGKALELAVKDAKANAQSMAKAAEITLSGVYNMEGSPQFGGFQRPMYAMRSMAAAAEASPTPIETGESTVTSDVTLRYKF